MNKILFITAIFFAIFLFFTLAKTPVKNQDYFTYTKAICNSTNFCQDNLVECDGKNLIKSTPITGASIQLSNNWKDPRIKNNFCE